MKILLLIVFFMNFPLASANDGRVERINFFPDADAWLSTTYTHTQLVIETPQETIGTKDLNSYYNLSTLAYAHRFGRKLFAGSRIGYENSSENTALYGIPLRKKFTDRGFIDPEFFMSYRLRFQKANRGSIDANLSLLPSLGTRKISRSTMNRFSGRTAMRLQLAHGFLEDRWEFQNLFGVTVSSAGKEEDEILEQLRLRYESSYALDYAFTTQLSLRENLFLSGTIGVTYKSTDVIHLYEGAVREFRSGTGSLFRLAIKQSFSNNSLLEVAGSLHRSEYFVKAEEFNLNGDANAHQLQVNYLVLF